jgi:hypothetical protein
MSRKSSRAQRLHHLGMEPASPFRLSRMLAGDSGDIPGCRRQIDHC